MIRYLTLTVLLVSGSAHATAKPGVADRPEILTKLVACRDAGNVNERVVCYDKYVAELDQAERAREVVLVDKQEMRRTRRSLFGFSLPRLKIFEGGQDEPEFTRIDAALAGAQRSGGMWAFDLNDGTRWIQSDSEELARSPKAGDRIRIRRAALGSFLANVGSAPAIRVRRVQ